MVKKVRIERVTAAAGGLEGTIVGSRLPSEPCSSWAAQLTDLLLGE